MQVELAGCLSVLVEGQRRLQVLLGHKCLGYLVDVL